MVCLSCISSRIMLQTDLERIWAAKLTFIQEDVFLSKCCIDNCVGWNCSVAPPVSNQLSSTILQILATCYIYAAFEYLGERFSTAVTTFLVRWELFEIKTNHSQTAGSVEMLVTSKLIPGFFFIIFRGVFFVSRMAGKNISGFQMFMGETQVDHYWIVERRLAAVGSRVLHLLFHQLKNQSKAVDTMRLLTSNNVTDLYLQGPWQKLLFVV